MAVMIDQKEIKSGDYIFCDHDGIIVVAESFKTHLRGFKVVSEILGGLC